MVANLILSFIDDILFFPLDIFLQHFSLLHLEPFLELYFFHLFQFFLIVECLK